MPPKPLPTPRAFLTSLFTTLASTPAPLPPPPDQPSVFPGNPLQGLGDDARGLLSTLHVLFPSQLLPALDLLDRRLVTRVIVRDVPARRPATARTDSSREDGVVEDDGEGDGRKGTYIVRSLASTMRRKAESKCYLVLLTAWSCTCPAFVFDAFPPASLSVPVVAGTPDDGPAADGEAWSFGGLSLDGLPGASGNVPCCKHLLACVLVEKWGAVLGKYALERRVTKEEMAGLVAEI
ncbi:hypothetical protein jhhlp_000434 [Lomentospora prolificans]|uniref:SWIM-type domain-containing protein n=1 Tax=Lomentospora prolificans TaxID=41688 RepID=A0A2N3NKX6_9PEZI|nr:hypothetical protein jhhlp_000434 [Lomentospora prolificans]